ncbi:hypothetical protein A3C34_00125 [Candidatus Amesbacteria bacterium RIFCSPHIGHO2_02_FULL_48_21]|uniref:Uncharacterized protein n=1 Tax=Candidatus Amesbacteria bacterium RIFOXYD1_FULL_47_9 TaxID=1797267 RepID=A0A1F4ZZ95_9BACT|nr:MAG: hypothetical protein A3C34_00125 [Candidatus Amesbacteria bacterium RIFCSPHIGHO2_02_FULL_48_21]OGD06746.1 MAG: hypothetical protein A3B58_02205 [Candidatus Amesbacteria bacterium RIFCSPLOWO2_01_FULL_48_50]OGD10817.1 MAG: hypothetical protein A2576_02030 [Candidatus Amesbacteria bacterium RIFOXYD1_FULL_47_9]
MAREVSSYPVPQECPMPEVCGDLETAVLGQKGGIGKQTYACVKGITACRSQNPDACLMEPRNVTKLEMEGKVSSGVGLLAMMQPMVYGASSERMRGWAAAHGARTRRNLLSAIKVLLKL